MKSRLLIIIGIIIAIGSVTTILTMNFSEDEKTTVSDTTVAQLEAIFEYCIDSKDLIDTVGLSYSNETHSIDTITCEWQKYNGVQIDSEGLDVNTRWITDEDYCQEWCDQNELYNLGCDQPILTHLTKYSNLLDEEFDGTFNIDWIGLPDGVTEEQFEKCVDIIYEKRLAESETKKFWKSTDDWNSLGLIRNDDGLYCSSASEESSDECNSLEGIVFGNARKSWTVFPGGVGPVPTENFTLTKIYKDSGFGMPTLNFTAMLDDKIFVNKCESNGGVWNYTYHDCENLWQVCIDTGGIIIEEDITPPCISNEYVDENMTSSTFEACSDVRLLRVSCVFEYEN